MKIPTQIFLAFVVFVIGTNAFNSKFKATTLTEVDLARYLKRGDNITCEITNIQRNVTYTLAHKGLEETVDTSSGISKTISINDDCWKFSVHRYDSQSYIWSKFRLLNAYNGSTYYFILAEHGVQIYRLHNKTENVEWEHYIEVEDLLPINHTTQFYVTYLANSYLTFASDQGGSIVELPIKGTSKPHSMVIEGNYVAPAKWIVKDCSNSTKNVTLDQFTVICMNSTNNNDTESNNQTSTYFTTLIETQYRIEKVMKNDLKDFKKWDNSKMIKELIEEFLSDVKDNYLVAQKTHRTILRFFKLNKYELNLKNKYLKDNTFRDTRRDYFELYQRAQLILSRFR